MTETATVELGERRRICMLGTGGWDKGDEGDEGDEARGQGAEEKSNYLLSMPYAPCPMPIFMRSLFCMLRLTLPKVLGGRVLNERGYVQIGG
ncbi:hypothetical protein NIES37_54900 [Tolypothrix tenuis PCC 7101]|uniref:Uncharacterized protein n=1 Tax=Tolypothrix tenuis PCC 7101 TaxID=231146 RepID=A0A1Z4N6Y6_9CYAN|nr:hypothetical protein NIES37_54900 [Tolypothrix tenuis PCC 7101]BAZ74589.1 hypothetical protein NIES50_31650 [Aulosira laxa NIES-50]